MVQVASTAPKRRPQLVYELREFYHIFRNLYVKNIIFSFLHYDSTKVHSIKS